MCGAANTQRSSTGYKSKTEYVQFEVTPGINEWEDGRLTDFLDRTVGKVVVIYTHLKK